jgi:hypothetical protein
VLREVDTPAPALGNVYEACLEIQSHYENSSSPHAAKLKEQWCDDWDYLHVPAHSAAYVLNPKYKGDDHRGNSDVWSEFLEVFCCLSTLNLVDFVVFNFSLFSFIRCAS